MFQDTKQQTMCWTGKCVMLILLRHVWVLLHLGQDRGKAQKSTACFDLLFFLFGDVPIAFARNKRANIKRANQEQKKTCVNMMDPNEMKMWSDLSQESGFDHVYVSPCTNSSFEASETLHSSM